MYLNRAILFLIFILFSSLPLTASVISGIKWKSTLKKKQFENYIKIEKGDKYSIKKIRRSIKLIYATGKVKQVRIIRTLLKDGSYFFYPHIQIPLSIEIAVYHILYFLEICLCKRCGDRIKQK